MTPTPREAAEAIGEQMCKLCTGHGRTEGVRMETFTTPVGALEYRLVPFNDPCAWCEGTGRITVDRMEMILLGKGAVAWTMGITVKQYAGLIAEA